MTSTQSKTSHMSLFCFLCQECLMNFTWLITLFEIPCWLNRENKVCVEEVHYCLQQIIMLFTLMTRISPEGGEGLLLVLCLCQNDRVFDEAKVYSSCMQEYLFSRGSSLDEARQSLPYGLVWERVGRGGSGPKPHHPWKPAHVGVSSPARPKIAFGRADFFLFYI